MAHGAHLKRGSALSHEMQQYYTRSEVVEFHWVYDKDIINGLETLLNEIIGAKPVDFNLGEGQNKAQREYITF